MRWESVSGRTRALAVLLLVFVAGLASGAVGDRLYVLRRPHEVREEAHREGDSNRDRERLPRSIRALHPTPSQQRRLHAIVAQWRPRARDAVREVRVKLSDLENDMFAHMMCVLSPAQRARYAAGFHRDEDEEDQPAPAILAARFHLVRTHTCPTDSAASAPNR